ncbi:MAG: hypothetical protein WC301_00300 [Candidatus Omnitrophota bacterium]|jgi:hypothetical protein
MRSKPSSGNLAKTALLLLSIPLCLILSGCQLSLEPTYKEKDISRLVKQICKDEYGLEVVTHCTKTTLWIYMPLSKMLHQDYAEGSGKFFDDELMDKLRNIMTTIGRVILSADKSPGFYALWSSDINIGIDYIIIGNVTDIKKSYAGVIPATELNQRYVIRFGLNPQAVGDAAGTHMNFYDITLTDFLAQQMAQRLVFRMQGEEIKKYFKVESSEGIFKDGVFMLEYNIIEAAAPEKYIDITQEALDIASYCVKTYEFRDFLGVWVRNILTNEVAVLDKNEVLARPMPVS